MLILFSSHGAVEYTENQPCEDLWVNGNVKTLALSLCHSVVFHSLHRQGRSLPTVTESCSSEVHGAQMAAVLVFIHGCSTLILHRSSSFQQTAFLTYRWFLNRWSTVWSRDLDSVLLMGPINSADPSLWCWWGGGGVFLPRCFFLKAFGIWRQENVSHWTAVEEKRQVWSSEYQLWLQLGMEGAFSPQPLGFSVCVLCSLVFFYQLECCVLYANLTRVLYL